MRKQIQRKGKELPSVCSEKFGNNDETNVPENRKEEDFTLEQLKCVKNKTVTQKRLYDKLRKQLQRRNRTPEQTLKENKKAKVQKSQSLIRKR